MRLQLYACLWCSRKCVVALCFVLCFRGSHNDCFSQDRQLPTKLRSMLMIGLKGVSSHAWSWLDQTAQAESVHTLNWARLEQKPTHTQIVNWLVTTWTSLWQQHVAEACKILLLLLCCNRSLVPTQAFWTNWYKTMAVLWSWLQNTVLSIRQICTFSMHGGNWSAVCTRKLRRCDSPSKHTSSPYGISTRRCTSEWLTSIGWQLKQTHLTKSCTCCTQEQLHWSAAWSSSGASRLSTESLPCTWACVLPIDLQSVQSHVHLGRSKAMFKDRLICSKSLCHGHYNNMWKDSSDPQLVVTQKIKNNNDKYMCSIIGFAGQVEDYSRLLTWPWRQHGNPIHITTWTTFSCYRFSELVPTPSWHPGRSKMAHLFLQMGLFAAEVWSMLSADAHSSSQCQALLRRAMSVTSGWHHGQRPHAEGLATNWPTGLHTGHQTCEAQMVVQSCYLHPAARLHTHVWVIANCSAFHSACVHRSCTSLVGVACAGWWVRSGG